MATPSEVKAGLDQIATDITTASASFERGKAQILGAYQTLDAIPTRYAGVLTEINGYGTADAFEAVSKAEKAKMQAEFVALKNLINDALTALGITP